jgi:hypothetical protein
VYRDIAPRDIASKPPDFVSDATILTDGTSEPIDAPRRRLDYLRQAARRIRGVLIGQMADVFANEDRATGRSSSLWRGVSRHRVNPPQMQTAKRQ